MRREDRGNYRRCCYWEMFCQHSKCPDCRQDKGNSEKKKTQSTVRVLFFLWLKQKGLETKGVMTVEHSGLPCKILGICPSHLFGWGVCHYFSFFISANDSHWARISPQHFPVAVLGSLSNKESFVVFLKSDDFFKNFSSCYILYFIPRSLMCIFIYFTCFWYFIWP